ncbi:MAG: hypothetical protein NXH88_07310 [Hyphomonas sp.]|nr:hypothetical protein [Hyphomonas sp.]
MRQVSTVINLYDFRMRDRWNRRCNFGAPNRMKFTLVFKEEWISPGENWAPVFAIDRTDIFYVRQVISQIKNLSMVTYWV